MQKRRVKRKKFRIFSRKTACLSVGIRGLITQLEDHHINRTILSPPDMLIDRFSIAVKIIVKHHSLVIGCRIHVPIQEVYINALRDYRLWLLKGMTISIQCNLYLVLENIPTDTLNHSLHPLPAHPVGHHNFDMPP